MKSVLSLLLAAGLAAPVPAASAATKRPPVKKVAQKPVRTPAEPASSRPDRALFEEAVAARAALRNSAASAPPTGFRPTTCCAWPLASIRPPATCSLRLSFVPLRDVDCP